MLEEILARKRRLADFKTVDLFCGCGGLSLGLEAAGMPVSGFDANPDAVKTCQFNLRGETQLQYIDKNFHVPKSDVIVGGPPCQPFSTLGLNLGRKDARDGFPSFVHAVQCGKPRLWMFENVTGLLRQNVYLDQIFNSLKKEGYKIEFKTLNAAEYGIPQARRRLVAFGWKKGKFSWPEKFSKEFNVNDAIGRLMTGAPKNARWLTPSMENYIERYERASNCSKPRDLDRYKPARTITCRNLAGATGDMLRVRLPDGRRRMLTVKEAARLQSFPDSYKFTGSFHSVMQQIGNAVPPFFGWQIGVAIRKHLE